MSQPMPPWLEKKFVDPKYLEEWSLGMRSQHFKIATLNGSFDLLHAGHLYIIHQASLQADQLIVLVNSDESIQAYKSPNRPIVPLCYRLELIAALEFVDAVSFFEESDPCSALARIAPDVHVNGIEYGENCIEAKVVKEHGGRLHLVDRIPGLATSEVLKKVKSL